LYNIIVQFTVTIVKRELCIQAVDLKFILDIFKNWLSYLPYKENPEENPGTLYWFLIDKKTGKALKDN
jgi:hypothetical protein